MAGDVYDTLAASCQTRYSATELYRSILALLGHTDVGCIADNGSRVRLAKGHAIVRR